MSSVFLQTALDLLQSGFFGAFIFVAIFSCLVRKSENKDKLSLKSSAAEVLMESSLWHLLLLPCFPVPQPTATLVSLWTIIYPATVCLSYTCLT